MWFLKLISFIFGTNNAIRNLSYGPQDDMVYDEYKGVKNKPVIIFWYGGSWQTGSKDNYKFVGKFFQKKGLNVIVADYPKYPNQTFPGFIDDAKLLISKINQSYPNNKIFLVGHSSGAHTALITAMTSNNTPVDGVIALSSPHCFYKKSWPLWKKIFDNTYQSKLQETFTYIAKTPKDTKFLITHGLSDKITLPIYSQKFSKLLANKSQYIGLARTGHIIILAIFLPIFYKTTKQRIFEFIGV